MESSISFNDVFLCANDLSILANARYGAIVRTHPVSANFLIEYGFLLPYAFANTDNEFVITPLGIQYLKYLDTILLEKGKEESRYKTSLLHSRIAIIISLISVIGNLLHWLYTL